jgi:lysophospholipid acyltransferase (LPLAT)-like uncharacterized protein
MAYAASRAWHFGWDRFVLPWPGSRIAIAVGEPVLVGRDQPLSDAACCARLQAQLEAALQAQFERAREALG